MGTPFVTLLEPNRLDGYQAGGPRETQPPSIPKAFLDAMEVREEVFVKEQGVELENEFDIDDPRSCHWVVYASVNKTDEPEVRSEDGNVIQPRRSSTRTTPVGTIRLIPFPQEPHPVVGGKYINNILESSDESVTQHTHDPLDKTLTIDRPTTFHDGKESYIKLGRLAVVKDFRGHRLAGLLVKTTLAWLKENPSYFDPSITELGLEQVGASDETDIPKWRGLVCVHAQEYLVSAYERWGFQLDEGMGKWWEEGIAHVGMFCRLDITS